MLSKRSQSSIITFFQRTTSSPVIVSIYRQSEHYLIAKHGFYYEGEKKLINEKLFSHVNEIYEHVQHFEYTLMLSLAHTNTIYTHLDLQVHVLNLWHL
jgi:hypothetical protein